MRGGFSSPLLFVAVSALACQPVADPAPLSRSAQPVTAGTPDDADPAVVAIVLSSDPTRLHCTGTLISERVVLTAAHCDVHYAFSSFAVFFGADLAAGGEVIRIIDAVGHPDFDETASHDLALLLLAEPAPAIPIEPVSDPRAAASPPVPLRLVGFGETDPASDDDGRKREGWTHTTSVTEDFVELGANPSLPCSGDSGGPVFVAVDDGERLAAVVSRGDAACSLYGKATRVDSHFASFVEPYLAATAAGSVSDGEPCLYDEQCSGAICLEAVDEPLFRYCSRGCGGAECPAPMTCSTGACRYPVPSPGAIGAPCGKHGDCLRGECLDEGWCSVRCVSGRGDCPGGYVCEHLGSIDFFCVPVPPRHEGGGGGGCATGRLPRGGTGPGMWLIAAALLLARRRSERLR